ncbi:MAG: nucleotidyltransferase domain-containing protein [Anaerolineales bacterium]|nr:nucleotidyltransferase domain-containing protein [Anaerolineales bacterium]
MPEEKSETKPEEKDKEMKGIIRKRLAEIEAAENVVIFYACESGSHAWGFPSANSDYNVRFLYVRPVEWYLSIEDKRDVIEKKFDGNLDISGWDLRKALNLFWKSNPPLYEWLNSPIVYIENSSLAEDLRHLMPAYYSPKSCIYHYLHMARGNFREYLRGDEVWLKKYFYVLRPILAINWIEQSYSVAPTAFRLLLDKIVTEPALIAEIENLIERKRNGDELDKGARIPVISEFIEQELTRLENATMNFDSPHIPINELDNLFRSTLAHIWNNH